MLSITIHSYRGGTGKTLLATNLAYLYSRKEKICLLDYDFRAPSIYKLLKEGTEPDYWINDYLNGDCEMSEALIELKPNLYVGLACHDAEVIRSMMAKGRSWETEALKRTMSLRETLANEGFSKIIFDTAPGFAYSSINAVVASDITAIVLRLDWIDIFGTKEMMKGVYEILEKPIFVVANMVLEIQQQIFGDVLEKTFGKDVLAHIPCSCDVRSFVAKGKDMLIDEDIGYSTAVRKLSDDIESFCKK